MATYNGEKFLSEQIESILRQTCTDWELFIHDDGSTDQTAKLIGRYALQYPEKIKLVHGLPCGGSRDNFFFLLRQVSAPYYMFCDQDDIWLEEKVEYFRTEMYNTEKTASAQAPILVFSDLTVTDDSLRIICDRLSVYQKLDPDKTSINDLLLQNVVTGCAMMINDACARKMCDVADTDDIIMHDWWGALVASYFGAVSYIDLPLVLYRQHGGNSVGAKRIGSLRYIIGKLAAQKEICESLQLTRAQAAVFAQTFSLPNDSLPSLYSRIGEERKLQRILFYRRNHMKKSGALRNIGMLIWG